MEDIGMAEFLGILFTLSLLAATIKVVWEVLGEDDK